MDIFDLKKTDTVLIRQISEFLFECFKKYSPEYLPDIAACKSEISESFNEVSRVMVNNHGEAIGWIGAIKGKYVWEIHPIAVSPPEQSKGLGQRLVKDIIRLAKEQGAVAVWAGTSDETGVTSFSGIDPYNSLFNNMTLDKIEAPTDHAVTFWFKAGFSLVGLLPDEEGLGKPGIHFAKRIKSSQ